MLTINFSPFPNLETERLLLRRVDTNDIKEIFALRSNPETMKYIPRPLVKTDEDALEHIAMIDTKIETNEGINWAITLKDNPKLIGVIGHYRIKPEHYRAEIGYILDPENHGSAKVLEKNGFVKEAHLKENEFFEGRFLDTVIYSILNK
jgi:ribosomal-protein-alanine N-acetyltransferase